MITGTIKNAVDMKVLDNKWQLKKDNINKKKPLSEMTQQERMLEEFRERAEQERESSKHADTYNKLKSGGRLTSEEIKYLEENDPEALQKYREDQAQKAAYERELKNCKSKEDVDRVKLNKLGELATRAKNITTDPYIPKDKKLELMNQLNNRLCLVAEAHVEFCKSKAYIDMPTEAEIMEENKAKGERREEAAEAVREDAEAGREAAEAVMEGAEAGMEDVEVRIETAEPASEEENNFEADFDKLRREIRKFIVSNSEKNPAFEIGV